MGARPLGFRKSGFFFSSSSSGQLNANHVSAYLSALHNFKLPLWFIVVTQTYLPNREMTVDQWKGGERNPATSQHLTRHDSVCVECRTHFQGTSQPSVSSASRRHTERLVRMCVCVCVGLFLHVCCSSVQCTTGDLQKGKIQLVPLCHISQTPY